MAGPDPTALSHATNCSDEYDVLGGYIPSFVQHLQDTRARFGVDLQASGGSNASVAATDAQGWTPAEYDAFFRALSVYSRWRPDLIAACVPTRSEWEVWMYLEALEKGAAAQAAQEKGEDADVEVEVPMHVNGSDPEANTDTNEDVCEAALEVSQAWIDVEERMASWIIEEEHRAALGGHAVADAPPKRKRGRPRGAGKGRARGRARAVADDDHQSPPRVDRSPSSDPSVRESSQELFDNQARESFMSRLEVPHLLVLDGILREGEEADNDKDKSREGSVTVTRTEYGDEGEPYVRDVEVPSSSKQIIAPQTREVSNMMIDPVLLALSGDADPVERHSPPPHVHTQDPSLLPQPLPPTQFAAIHTNPDLAASTEPDLSVFSPRSRRRIQKRLYMRRKRAVTSEGVVDTGIEKLRPGKRAKSERRKTSAVSTPPPSDAEGEMEIVRKNNKGGLTLPYKLKARFAELGIDAAYLRGQGMDLLNLGALGRLTGLCSSLADGDGSVQSIDAEFIQHLQAAITLFVTDIMHRAIVWREREIRLKQRSQAWRQGDHITVAAIEHAVAIVDASHRSPKEYFGPRCRSETPDQGPSAVADGEAEDISSELPRFSPHREVYTPLVRPPPEWRIDPLSCLAQTYEREATRTRRGPSAGLDEELMSDETDEEALGVALAADAAVDERDGAAGAAVEAGLFEGVVRLDLILI